MKLSLRIISDLHLEFRWHILPPLPSDKDTILMLAGDISADQRYYGDYLEENAGKFAHVFHIAGNHEHYGKCYQDSMDQLRGCSGRYPNVHFLEASQPPMQIGGYLFMGATLWTDFEGNNPKKKEFAHRMINDYSHIRYHRPDYPDSKLTPDIVYGLFKQDLRGLTAGLEEAKEKELKAIVMTHNAPSHKSVAPQYANDPLNYLFVNHLDSLIGVYQPATWIHGHTHTQFDYRIGNTRVVCNPRGYPGENKFYDSDFTV